MPTPRRLPRAIEVGGRVFVFGGFPCTDGPALNALEIYDPVTDGWSTGAAMPTARGGFGIGLASGQIRVLGGATELPVPTLAQYTDVVESYDPLTDTWTNCGGSCTPLPRLAFAPGFTTLRGRIHLVSGWGEASGSTQEYR